MDSWLSKYHQSDTLPKTETSSEADQNSFTFDKFNDLVSFDYPSPDSPPTLPAPTLSDVADQPSIDLADPAEQVSTPLSPISPLASTNYPIFNGSEQIEPPTNLDGFDPSLNLMMPYPTFIPIPVLPENWEAFMAAFVQNNPYLLAQHLNTQTATTTNSVDSAGVTPTEMFATPSTTDSTEEVINCVKVQTDGKSKFKCPSPGCEKTYCRPYNVKLHYQSTHVGHKPYTCDFLNCNASFARKYDMLRHRKIHEGTKNFHCNYCQTRFTRREHLKAHLRNAKEGLLCAGKRKREPDHSMYD